MEEENPRGVWTILGLSLAFFFIAVLMKASGTATPVNPVWQIISIVTQVFVWPLVLLLLAVVATLPIVLMNAMTDCLAEQVRARRQAAQYKWEIFLKNEEYKRKKKQHEEEEKVRQEQFKIQELEKQRKEEESRIHELNRRKARSPEDAP